MLVYHKAAPAQSNSKPPVVSQFTFLVKHTDTPPYTILNLQISQFKTGKRLWIDLVKIPVRKQHTPLSSATKKEASTSGSSNTSV